MATSLMLLSSGLTVFLLASSVFAAPLSCPTYSHGFRLKQFGIFDGDPAKLYEHAPDDEAAPITTYNVKLSLKDEGYHLLCTYYNKSKVDLRIPPTATLCTVEGNALAPNTVCK